MKIGKLKLQLPKSREQASHNVQMHDIFRQVSQQILPIENYMTLYNYEFNICIKSIKYNSNEFSITFLHIITLMLISVLMKP